MKCGHKAQAVDSNDNPVCIICIGIHKEAAQVEDDLPNLEGRKAYCVYKDCKNIKDSSFDLAFFEYCGNGSLQAKKCKNCKCVEQAHNENSDCKDYKPQGDLGFDRFYCGCKGWD